MRFLLLTIITLLPTYLIRFRIGPIPTTAFEVLLLITVAYWIAQKIKTKNYSLPVTRYSLPAIVFLLAGTISVFVSPNTRAALGLWKAYVVEPMLFFFMFVDTLRPRSGQAGWPTIWRDVTVALSISALGVALPAIYQKFNPIGIPNIHWAAVETRRVTSWYGFPNAIGLYLAPIIPLLVGWIVKEKRWSIVNCQLSIVTIAALAAIVFARSEGALAALAVVGIIAGLLTKRTRVATAVIAIVFLAATLTNTPWREYFYEQITLRREAGPVRVAQWKETVAMLKDHPIFGAGLSGYPTIIAPYHKTKHIEIYQYPHNIILNFWSETGLLGLIAFLWLIVIFFKTAIQKMKKLEIGNWKLEIPLLAAMTVLLIHGAVDAPYFKNDLAIFFWLLLALTMVQNPPIVKGSQ